MNFQDLMSKIKAIDEGHGPADEKEMPLEPNLSSDDELMFGEKSVDECGMPGMSNMPSGMMGMSAPKQADNVTMNLSMNGSGAGGIRDLMNLLKDIQSDGQSDDAGEIVVGMGEESDPNVDFKMATTDSKPEEQEVQSIASVLPTGNDLASKGLRGRGGVSVSGSNALAEQLAQQLGNLYQEIKGR